MGPSHLVGPPGHAQRVAAVPARAGSTWLAHLLRSPEKAFDWCDHAALGPWAFRSVCEPVRGCFGRLLSASRLTRAHSEALGSDPLSRGAGSTHSSRRRLSWLDTAVTASPEAIGAEHPGALTMAVRPFLAAQALEGDSLCARSKAVARGSCTCGRSVMGDRSIWSQRAEAVAITVGIDALAGRMVPGGASEVERSSTGPRAQSWQLGVSQAVQMRPLGQGGRLGSAGERAPASAQWGW